MKQPRRATRKKTVRKSVRRKPPVKRVVRRKVASRGKGVARKPRLDSGKVIRARLAAQREAGRQRLAYRAAVAARRAYKVRKGDRGRLVMIGVKGAANPSAKGRKGYLIEVTKRGKKRLVRIKGIKNPFKPRKISEIESPGSRYYRKKAKVFQLSRRETVHRGRAVQKAAGSVTTGSSVFDFNETVVKKIALSIRRAMTAQRSKRRFLITAMALVELPDGSETTFQFEVAIDKADNIAIRLAGLLNFVRMKFYAFMAKELMYSGYVSSGSFNHIRRLSENAFAAKGDLVDKDGEPWRGNGLEVVRIKVIEWTIEQIK